jgi:hypothetical protein
MLLEANSAQGSSHSFNVPIQIGVDASTGLFQLEHRMRIEIYDHKQDNNLNRLLHKN